MESYIGKMLDNRYEILELIGTGGMAYVYKAKCHLLNRLVAVKILKSELANDADFRRRFKDESRAVAMLSHPNIMAVYDVSRREDMDYIVMELLDGITLKQYMERRGQMDWREALHFITQILKALSHAHSRGIIHRDIKPHNIMILRDGTAKVTDFGIACLSNAAQTLTQEALGSVHYISPEQATGSRPDARSDIYSAGIVLYEMLTNRLPFEGDNAVSVAIQHLNSVPLSPREINSDVPPSLELICMKAMASDISKRYNSADEMLVDLEKFRKDPSVELNFVLQDLQKDKNSEPTRMIDTSAVRAEQRKQREERQELLPEDDDDDEDEDDEEYEEEESSPLKRILIGLLIAALAVGLVFGLGSMIKNSMKNNEPPVYAAPSVLGMTMEQAQQIPEIADGTWSIHIQGERVSEKPKGEILEQSPTAGTEKKSGLVIEVYLSSGPKLPTLPNIVGKEYRIAQMTLNNMDLKLNVVIEETFNDVVEVGYVISTEPAAGAELREGDTVTVYCSKGPEPVMVKVPNFVGSNIDTVQAWLDSLKLEIGQVTEEVSYLPVGQVIKQSAEADSMIEEGSAVDFIISGGPFEKDDEDGTGAGEEFFPW